MTVAELRIAQRRGMVALMGHEVRRVVSLWTQTLVPPVVTGCLFLAVFGGALGSRLREICGVEKVTFILPGLLVMTVASQGLSNNATSLFHAKSDGYIEDVLTSPLRGWHLALGYASGGLVRGLGAALALAILAAPFAGVPERPLLTAAALALTALVFSALGVITGMWAETFDQHAFVANLVVTPLALIAGVFYSPESLEEPWSTLTRADPLYYLVDATRAGFTGSADASLWLSLSTAAVAAMALATVATAALARGWRLKP